MKKYIVIVLALLAATTIGVGLTFTNKETATTVNKPVTVPSRTTAPTAEAVTIAPSPSAKPESKKSSEPAKPSEASEKPVETQWANPTQKPSKAVSGNSRKPEAPSKPSTKVTKKPEPSKSAETKPSESTKPEPVETEEPFTPGPLPEPETPVYAWLDKAAYEAPAGWGGFTVTYEGNFSYVEVRADGKVYRSDVNAQWVPAIPGTYTVRITPYSSEGYSGVDWELEVVVPE